MTEPDLSSINQNETPDNIDSQTTLSDNSETQSQESKISSDTKQHDSFQPKRNKDPLHGVTLEQILTRLVDIHGWDGLAENISIRCFINNPSIKSSLIFLQKTPWARKKVENLFINECI